jgi:hypothetical protein
LQILLAGKLFTRAFLLSLGGSVEQARCNLSSHSAGRSVISEGANFVQSIHKEHHLIYFECEKMFAATHYQ